MMRAIRYAIPAVIAVTGLLMTPTGTYAKREFTAKEKKACVYCHVTATSKELNAAGKYYKENKSLEGYKK